MTSKQDNEATLVSHLEALRRVLIRSFVALLIGIVPLFFLSPYILDWFSNQVTQEGQLSLHYFSPMEVFLLQVKIAALLDCVLFSPYIAWNIWQFVLPALYDNEKKFIRSMAFLTSFLFMAGVAFCLLVCFPMVVQFGMSFAGTNLQPIFGISNLVSLALWLSLAFGCMFQFPLVTYALVRSGIVEYDSICNKRPYVAVAILVLAALLTPPDIISQMLLGAPTYLLFEIGLFAARGYKGKSRQKPSEYTPNEPAADSFRSTASETDSSNAPDSSENKESPANKAISKTAPNTGTNKNANNATAGNSQTAVADEIDFTEPNSRYQVGTEKNSDQWKPY